MRAGDSDGAALSRGVVGTAAAAGVASAGVAGTAGVVGAAGAAVAGVIVVGVDGAAVGASVAAQRSLGGRVAGFVGDLADNECVVAVRAMAAELFPDCEIVMPQ